MVKVLWLNLCWIFFSHKLTKSLNSENFLVLLCHETSTDLSQKVVILLSETKYILRPKLSRTN